MTFIYFREMVPNLFLVALLINVPDLWASDRRHSRHASVGGGMTNQLDPRNMAAINNTASRKFLQEFLQDIPPPIIGPVFDKTVPNNVTGLVGRTAYLHCRVKNLGNRTVSWIRHRDIHLLTAGRYTYTSDQRFEAIHEPHSENWSLRIKYPQKKDSGIYECQISTTPPVGHPVYLTVLEPTTEILGGPELFIDQGSTINLTCLIQFAPEPPPTVGWTHEKQPINFDSPRGGISLVTEKGSTTSSRLLIQKASSSDTGYYSCDPSNANSATVRVHILNGEHPAAMHHGQGSIPLCPPIVSAMIVPFLLIFTARDL
ncbi:zwei Ig domain protein zig-8-like isoform X1 [Sipha flava]|uniref:Lachesin n=1 Tax=Sipha flava TaxID=143950 RepID=A0A2S2Q445_9HEMI|nr:zwei Ig domain protein zig-8-like isoform X1 [Sipha flava]XP_025405297.1 zwei Ig domain protein zig-8-like isoform X1 [Sipha flava]